jgi:hypothetical protein
MAGGSASALSLSRPAQASLTLPPAGSLSRPRRPLSRGSGPSGYPAEPLVSYQTNRQLSGWNPPPLVIRALGAHCQKRTSYPRGPDFIELPSSRRGPRQLANHRFPKHLSQNRSSFRRGLGLAFAALLLCLPQLLALIAIERLSGFLRLLFDATGFDECLSSFAVLAISGLIALALIGPRRFLAPCGLATLAFLRRLCIRLRGVSTPEQKPSVWPE